MARWRELDDADELASALDSLGWPFVYDSNNNTRALEAFEHSLELRRELGDAAGVTRALVGIAQVLVAMGETERAEAIAHDLLDRAAGDERTEHFAHHFLADCALIGGDPEEAGARYRQSLRAALPLGDVVETSLRCRVWRCRRPGGAIRTARSSSLARSTRCGNHSDLSISIAFWDALIEQYLAPARASLGDGSTPSAPRGERSPSTTPASSRSATEIRLQTNAHVESRQTFPCPRQDPRRSSRRAVDRTAEEVRLDLADPSASEFDVTAAGALVGLLKLFTAQTCSDVVGHDRRRGLGEHPGLGHGQRGNIAQRVHVRKSGREVSVVHGHPPSQR